MFNTHIHIFRDIDVPDRFLPLYLVRILSNKFCFNIIAKFLNYLNPFSNNDLFDRYVNFITIGNLGSQENIFNECAKYYDNDTKFVVLTMDMAYMGCGNVKRPFLEQLIELSQLKNKYPNILPYVHIDPRRHNPLLDVKNAIEHLGFNGVKIYPSLGYFPYDSKLYPIYEYCEKNNIPIISHCSPYNPVHFKGSRKELKKLLLKSKIPINTNNKSIKELCSNFSNPNNWKCILQKFPNLKICAAHFGSEYYWDKYLENPIDKDNWFIIIKDMIKKYDNFYTDIAFTLNNEKYFPLLKLLLQDDTIRHKILFGSDYYMVETKSLENNFNIDLRAYLGEYLFELISELNPKIFLNL